MLCVMVGWLSRADLLPQGHGLLPAPIVPSCHREHLASKVASAGKAREGGNPSAVLHSGSEECTEASHVTFVPIVFVPATSHPTSHRGVHGYLVNTVSLPCIFLIDEEKEKRSSSLGCLTNFHVKRMALDINILRLMDSLESSKI